MPITINDPENYPFAEPADVAAVWRPLSEAESAIATTLLSRVSAMIRYALPGINARVGNDPVLTELVRGVAVDAVLRVLKNPDGKQQESIDDYSWTRDGSLAAGALYVSQDELATLMPRAGNLGGAYVVSLSG